MSLNGKKNSETSEAENRAAATPGPVDGLLAQAPQVLNVGVPGFAEELAGQGVSVLQVDWRPPAGGDVRLAKILSIVGT